MIANVLIVVDVQNCLMDGGDISKTETLVSEIADLVETIPFDYYVITRDSHPSNHASHMVSKNANTVIVNHKNGRRNSISSSAAFLGSPAISKANFEQVTPLGGPWAPHCKMTPDEFVNINKCMPRKNLGEINSWNITTNNVTGKSKRFQKNSQNQLILPTHPSKYYKQHYDRVPILKYFNKPDMKLHIVDVEGEQFKEPTDTKLQLTVTNIPGSKDMRGPVLHLFKGQHCNWDAYSAFQNHADLRRGQFVNDVRSNLNNTTGLAEVLFSKELGITHFKPGVEKVNIVVCGLMGEVAVKYTVSYGLSTLIQAKNQGGLQGYSRIEGFLITPAEIPKVNFIYSAYATRFIPYPLIIAGDYGIRNEVEARISEAGISEDVTYEILLPPDSELLDKIDTVGAVVGSAIRTLTDSIGLTKTGGKRRTRRRKFKNQLI